MNLKIKVVGHTFSLSQQVGRSALQSLLFSLSGMLLVLALAIFLWPVAGAAAHALLLKSEPQAGAALEQSPEQVVAWFSQELDTDFSSLMVVDTAGRQVDNGDGRVDLYDPDHASLIVTLPPSLPDGLYTVQWTAVSVEDGDTTAGEFRFGVGEGMATAGQLSTAETRPTGGSDWPLAWLVAGLVVLLLLGLGLALLRRPKASLLLIIGLAGLVLWVYTQKSPAVSAAPVATLRASNPLPLELKSPPMPITPLVSARSPVQSVPTPIPFLAPLTLPILKPAPLFRIHTVQAGETLISIAASYDLTGEQLLAANDIRDPARLGEGRKLLIPSPDQPDQGRIIPYEIREGDTLLSLASKYGSSVTAIERANPHLGLDLLSPGKTIAIPVIFSEAQRAFSGEAPVETIYHTVQRGETPLAIASAYDLPVEILLTANHIEDPKRLQIGQKLIIPPHLGITQNVPVVLYELTAGDTLVGIASRFGSGLKDILAANPDLDPASWEAGQLVAIPVIFAPPRPASPPLALPSPPDLPPPGLTDLQQQVIEAVNRQRELFGLAPYLPDEQLSAVALAHAQDMVVRDFLAHITPDGKTLRDRLAEGGVEEVTSTGENIQRNARSPKQTAQVAVNWFMDSAPHRYNLLNDQYNRLGVGAVEGASGWYTFVLVFAQR